MRAAVMTIPNYYVIVYISGTAATIGFLKDTFGLVGITLTDANAMVVILGFTAIFNALQLLLVIGVSSLVLRVPSVSRIRIGGRSPWFTTLLREGGGQSVRLAP